MTNQFGYNPRSELVSAAMDTNNYGYAYDPIGNRTSATNDGEVLTYLSNLLNQYTNVSDGAAVAPLYDPDGNLTNYGALAFTWDGENRLVSVSSNGTQLVAFKYDHQSRRVARIAGSATNAFLYDGWAMVCELQGGVGIQSVTNSYVYGPELSGSMQGAGTIGGLLSVAQGPTSNVCYYAYDANGNVKVALKRSHRGTRGTESVCICAE